MKKLICGAMIMALALLLFNPAPVWAQARAQGFGDLSGHWAEKSVAAVCDLALMNGMGENEAGDQIFSPDTLVSRAQLAVILQRTFELGYGERSFIKEPQASDYYQDVESADWFAEAVKYCAINQIFDPAAELYPEQAVSRIEVARALHRSVMAKGLHIPVILLMPYYQDMEGLSPEDNNALIFASNTSLMKGDGLNWRPWDEITRGEMAVLINNLVRILALSENDSGSEYQVEPGNSFFLLLDSNISTGYSWTAAYDEKALALIGRHYQQEGEGNHVGQGGKDIWRFKALQTGSTELKMFYACSWESFEPEKAFSLKIAISPMQADTGEIRLNSRVLKEKSDIMDLDLEIPVLSGPLEAGLLLAINQRFEREAMEIKQSMENELGDYIAECKAGDHPIRPYNLYTRYQLCSLDDKLLSLYMDYYQYTGGAHGITERRPYNIDLKSGELLPLAAIFKSGYDYKAVIEQEIRRQIALDPEPYFTGEMGFKAVSEEQGYYLEDENLVLYFGQYEIAPYAAGIPEFKIPLKLLDLR